LTPLKGIWAVAAHDLLMWRRMPLAVACALIPPLGMGLLIVVLTLTVSRQPVALVVQSHGPNSERMARLVRSDEDAYTLTETGVSQAAAMLRDQRVAAIITVPAGFDTAVEANSAELNLTLNNVDIDFSDDIRRSVERSAGEFDGLVLGHDVQDDPASEETADADSRPEHESSAKTEKGDAPDLAGPGSAENTPDRDDEKGIDAHTAEIPNAYHIGITEHDLRVTNVDFLHYQVVPVLILLVLSVGLMGTAMLCAADVERGTARLFLASPLSIQAMVTGRMLGGMIASLAVLAVGLVLCFAIHAISPPAGHWMGLICLFGCTGMCASGLGAMLGAVMRGQRNVAMASSILATYLFFLGGGFTTIAFLPPWLQTISQFNPIRYAVDGMRQALFYPDLRGFGADLAVLAGTAIASVLLGSAAAVRSWRA